MPPMKALRIHAGPRARQPLQNHGLQPGDVGVIPASAGGPKGLILGPLDRFIFGEWLPQSSQPVHLVGASIGAWRMATACLQQSVAAFERLEHDYIHQHYDLPPGKKRPTAAHVSERFGQNLQAFYGGRIDEVLNHPRYRLHIVTSRGRHLLGREHRVATPLGYLGAFLTNTLHRKAMGAWLERVVFSSSDAATADGVGVSVGAACAALPFGTSDYRTRQVVPGWLDKGLKWRHRSTPALDNMVVLSPSPDWVRSLPNAKLPDRNDFTHYGTDSAARAKAWLAATRGSQQLVDEWQAWLARPDMNAVQPL